MHGRHRKGRVRREATGVQRRQKGSPTLVHTLNLFRHPGIEQRPGTQRGLATMIECVVQASIQGPGPEVRAQIKARHRRFDDASLLIEKIFEEFIKKVLPSAEMMIVRTGRNPEMRAEVSNRQTCETPGFQDMPGGAIPVSGLQRPGRAPRLRAAASFRGLRRFASHIRLPGTRRFR